MRSCSGTEMAMRSKTAPTWMRQTQRLTVKTLWFGAETRRGSSLQTASAMGYLLRRSPWTRSVSAYQKSCQRQMGKTTAEGKQWEKRTARCTANLTQKR